MIPSRTLLPLVALTSVAAVACARQDTQLTYQKEVRLSRPIEFRPARLPGGGAPTDHACIRGDYYHVYETDNGLYGQSEVWLCCVPVEEILSESFNCAGESIASVLPTLFGDADDAKIRYCSLLHPTETEPTYIPVCIPAPLEAPGVGETTIGGGSR